MQIIPRGRGVTQQRCGLFPNHLGHIFATLAGSATRWVTTRPVWCCHRERDFCPSCPRSNAWRRQLLWRVQTWHSRPTNCSSATCCCSSAAPPLSPHLRHDVAAVRVTTCKLYSPVDNVKISINVRKYFTLRSTGYTRRGRPFCTSKFAKVLQQRTNPSK